MFREIITEEQKRIIRCLAEDHSDALIAFGADMYRKGIYKGAIVATVGFFAGAAVQVCYEEFMSRHKTN